MTLRSAVSRPGVALTLLVFVLLAARGSCVACESDASRHRAIVPLVVPLATVGSEAQGGASLHETVAEAERILGCELGDANAVYVLGHTDDLARPAA